MNSVTAIPMLKFVAGCKLNKGREAAWSEEGFSLDSLENQRGVFPVITGFNFLLSPRLSNNLPLERENLVSLSTA